MSTPAPASATQKSPRAPQPAAPSLGYEFTNDWFSMNIPIWDKLVPNLKPARLLEIGSFEGRSTCYLIEKCAAIQPIEIHCVDSWQGGIEHQAGGFVATQMGEVEQRFERNVAFAQKRVRNPARIIKHKKLSHLALAEILAEEKTAAYDFVYVDGSHQAPDVLADCVLSFHLLKPGGLMIFDDYLWSMEQPGRQDPLNMPKPAIDAFLNIFQRKMRIIAGAPIHQIYATKLAA
jgi:predicted O-methyltransferase YrrM